MITVVTRYYNNPEAFNYAKPNLIKHGRVIVIDDCANPPLKTSLFTVYRMKNDVMMNQQAFNLGVLKAKTDKVMTIDLDHTCNFSQIEELELPEKTIYLFERLSEGFTLRPNPSAMLFRRADFIEIGGRNHEYSGNYGYADTDFLRRAKRMGYSVKIAPIKIHVNANLGTKNISRDTTINKKLFDKDKPLTQLLNVNPDDYECTNYCN